MNPNPVHLCSDDDPDKVSHALHFGQISVGQHMKIDTIITLPKGIPN
jgi:hypothetical protein